MDQVVTILNQRCRSHLLYLSPSLELPLLPVPVRRLRDNDSMISLQDISLRRGSHLYTALRLCTEPEGNWTNHSFLKIYVRFWHKADIKA